MPIDSENAKYSIEFSWSKSKKKNKKNTDGDVEWHIKYHYTQALGDTITVVVGDQQSEIPADLWSEVTDHLRARGFLVSSEKIDPIPEKKVIEEISSLPLPTIINDEKTVKEKIGDISQVADPVQSFSIQKENQNTRLIKSAKNKTNVRKADVRTKQEDDIEDVISDVGEGMGKNILQHSQRIAGQLIPETPEEWKTDAIKMKADRMKKKNGSKKLSIKRL